MKHTVLSTHLTQPLLTHCCNPIHASSLKHISQQKVVYQKSYKIKSYKSKQFKSKDKYIKKKSKLFVSSMDKLKLYLFLVVRIYPINICSCSLSILSNLYLFFIYPIKFIFILYLSYQIYIYSLSILSNLYLLLIYPIIKFILYVNYV